MAGEIEHRGIGILRQPGKARQRRIHAALVEIDAVDHFEADLAQSGHHVARIVHGVRQRGGVAIAGIADDQRDATLGRRLGQGEAGQQQEEQAAESRDEGHGASLEAAGNLRVMLMHDPGLLQNKA